MTAAPNDFLAEDHGSLPAYPAARGSTPRLPTTPIRGPCGTRPLPSSGSRPPPGSRRFLPTSIAVAETRHSPRRVSASGPAEAVATGSQLVYRLGSYEPDYPRFSLGEILDCHESVPELEALRRWTMTLHN